MKKTTNPHQPWLRQLAAMCVLPVAVSTTALAQDINKTAPKAEPAPAPTAPAQTTVTDDDILVLTPFTVGATKDRGYFSENTLAGSRMKTKLSDLASSISVVNKAQIQDFASLDINDVFRYEAGTEGSNTYTPSLQSQKGDGLLDQIAGGTNGGSTQVGTGLFTNSTANRVRGLGAAQPMINYYKSISTIPADSYNTQSYEISRGANSVIYGLGSPAGMVNQSTGQADVNKNTEQVEIRTDDRGSFRSSLSFNRALLKGKLAIYGASLYDDREFERKPSYDITRRQYAALAYKPFSKTVLNLNFENYNNSNRRPNTISPLDAITPWKNNGMPTYDPVTKRVTYLDPNTSPNHVLTSGPFVYSASSTATNGTTLVSQELAALQAAPGYNPALLVGNNYNGISIYSNAIITNSSSPLYVPAIAISNARPLMQIVDGRVASWYQVLNGGLPTTSWSGITNVTTPTNAAAAYANATWADYFNRDQMESTSDEYARGRSTQALNPQTGQMQVMPLRTIHARGLTDKSVMDWSKINVNSTNYGNADAKNYYFDLQQQITPDLFVSGGWFRQVSENVSNYSLGQQNATMLKVDVNKNQPDGSPNPFFGQPFVSDIDPDQYINRDTNDQFRAMAAYTPDFTKHDGWMKWLGHHQILGMWTREEDMNASIRNRMNYIGAGNDFGMYRYLPNPNVSGWSYQANTRSLRRSFYMANPGSTMGVVTHSPGTADLFNGAYAGNIRSFDYTTNSFVDSSVVMAPVTMGGIRSQRLIQSYVAAMTSYLWDERIIPTVGYRVDKAKYRSTSTGAITAPDGTAIPALTNAQLFPDGTMNQSMWWNRFDKAQYINFYTKTAGAVIRPFKGWSAIERGSDNGNLFWEFVRDLGISYNWSNSADIPGAAQYDLFHRDLPKPGGNGYDMGLQFDLLKNRLYARVTWFHGTSQSQRISNPTAMSRLVTDVEQNLYRNWARTIALINAQLPGNKSNPTSSSWNTGLTSAEEAQIQAATSQIYGLDYNYWGFNTAATQNADAKGVEIQVNYNTDNWRNKITFSKTDTKYNDVMPQYEPWLNYRMPAYLNAKASDYLLPAFASQVTGTFNGGAPYDLTNFWTSYGYHADARAGNTNGATNVANYYSVFVKSAADFSRDSQGQTVMGQRRYNVRYTTGYDFNRGMLKGWSVGGAERWESKAIIGYYGRATGANLVTFNGVANVPQIDASDLSRPIYDNARYYTDVFVKYQRKIWANRVLMTYQLNVENAFEGGRLQVVAVDWDGVPYGYRIVDPRRFVLSARFDF
ncbi:MAG: TonB-dependent receptor [Nibricoccus sp.]